MLSETTSGLREKNKKTKKEKELFLKIASSWIFSCNASSEQELRWIYSKNSWLKTLTEQATERSSLKIAVRIITWKLLSNLVKLH